MGATVTFTAMTTFDDVFTRRAHQHLPQGPVLQLGAPPISVRRTRPARIDCQGRLALGTDRDIDLRSDYVITAARAGDITLDPRPAGTRRRRTQAHMDKRGRLQLNTAARSHLQGGTVLVLEYTDARLRLVTIDRCLQGLDVVT